MKAVSDTVSGKYWSEAQAERHISPQENTAFRLLALRNLMLSALIQSEVLKSLKVRPRLLLMRDFRVCTNLLYGTNPKNGQRASRNQNYRFN